MDTCDTGAVSTVRSSFLCFPNYWPIFTLLHCVIGISLHNIVMKDASFCETTRKWFYRSVFVQLWLRWSFLLSAPLWTDLEFLCSFFFLFLFFPGSWNARTLPQKCQHHAGRGKFYYCTCQTVTPPISEKLSEINPFNRPLVAGCCNGTRPPLPIVYLFCRLFWACWCVYQRRFSLIWCYYDVTVNTKPEGNDNRSTCVWPDGPMWWKWWTPCFCIQVVDCVGSAFVVSGSFFKSVYLYLCEWTLSPSDC